MKNGRKNEVIYSYRTTYENIKDRLLSKKINVDFFVVDNEEMIQNEVYNEIFQNKTKACFYKKLSSKYTEEKINNSVDIELILMSDKIINDINYESYEKIKRYENVIIFLLEQYKLNISSTRDKLTGAYNRRYFEKTMNNIIMNYNYTENIFSLIIFDIDNFKGVNDKFGHQTGDIVLEKISSIVLEEIENKDIFSRYGGEEFVIICPGKNSEEAYEKADNIRKKIQEADILRGRREVTVSMGISEYPKHSKKKEELISKADQALYKAKRGTKNIVKIWDETFDIKIEGSDILAGIMTGNTSKDYERISSIVKIIEIIKKDIRNEFKLYDILTKILKLTESRECMLFKTNNNNEIICEMSIRERERGWKNIKYFNRKLIDNVFKEGNGLYDIDWDEVVNENKTMPKWNSICIVPIINEDEVKGAIYMSVPLKRKEFDFKDYNYVNTIGNILSILF
ncbi:GGDEF domain-containing protein [Clostridium thermobutyricum]|uniref:GGDEF domain-containing protein n=1 Tax=Clostridium thermobutyricum TaxID=29372 RepID=UPI003F523CEC